MLKIFVLAAAALSPQQSFDMPGYQYPGAPWEDVLSKADQELCEEQIRVIRAELIKAGEKPAPVNEGPKAEVTPAIDRSENGCPMLVTGGEMSKEQAFPQVEQEAALRPLD